MTCFLTEADQYKSIRLDINQPGFNFYQYVSLNIPHAFKSKRETPADFLWDTKTWQYSRMLLRKKETPLHIAAYHGNAVPRWPLRHCCANSIVLNDCVLGNLENVFLLCRYKEDLDYQTTDGWTALHYACALGNIDITRTLLDAGANPLLRTVDQGHNAATAPELALMGKHWKCVFAMLENPNVDPNTITIGRGKWTPLQLAVYQVR